MKKLLLSLFLLVNILYSNELMLHSDETLDNNLNVKFDSKSYKINDSEVEGLNRYVEYLFNHPYLSIDLKGHTDSQGSDNDNMKLSIKRAETVKSYFLNEGIIESRINTIACGESEPKVKNDTEENRQINRRVESKTFVTFE